MCFLASDSEDERYNISSLRIELLSLFSSPGFYEDEEAINENDIPDKKAELLFEDEKFHPTINETKNISDFDGILFIISDIYRKSNETILRLSHSLKKSNYLVHLHGRWLNLKVHTGDPLFVITTPNPICSNVHKPNNNKSNILNKKEVIIDNTNGYIIIWPFYMISATRLSKSVHCLRYSVLYPLIPCGSASTSMTTGTIAHEIVQKVLTGLEIEEIPKEMDKLINENLLETTIQGVTKEELTNKLNPLITRAAEISIVYKEKIEQMKKENIEIEKINLTEMMPPYGMTVINEEENLMAINLGLLGKSDVTLFDSNREKLFPLEMKSGKSANSQPKDTHRAQLTTYIMIMKEKYLKKSENFGMLYYMEDNVSVKVEPSNAEKQSLLLLRNRIVEDSIYGEYPEKISNNMHCETCDSYEICGFIGDIEDGFISNSFSCQNEIGSNQQKQNKNENEKENKSHVLIDLTKNENDILQDFSDDFSQNDIKFLGKQKSKLNKRKYPKYSERQIEFFKRLDDDLKNETKYIRDEQSSVWLLEVEKREELGLALNNLTFYNSMNGSIICFCSKIIVSKFKIFSTILITKKGKFPILGTGNIIMISPEDGCFEIKLDENKISSELIENKWNGSFCIDLFLFATDQNIGRQNLMRLFAYSQIETFRRISSFLIDNDCKNNVIFNNDKKPKRRRHHKISYQMLLYGMNDYQKKAIISSVNESNIFSIISGCKNSGKTIVLSLLLQYFNATNKKVLVIGPSDESVDRLCIQIVDQLQFIRVTTLVTINPVILPYTINKVLQECKSTDEVTMRLNSCKVFITSLRDFRHQYLSTTSFDLLLVEDCENIKIQHLLGPIAICKKYIFCGDIHQVNVENSIYSMIDKNLINFLRIQYNKNVEIFDLENALIYNYTLHLHNYYDPKEISENENRFDLNKIDDFHMMHKSWLVDVLSTAVFALFVKEDGFEESVVIAIIVISLIICGIQPDNVGILCYDKKSILLIRNSINELLSVSSCYYRDELNDIQSINQLIEIHHVNVYRNRVDHCMKKCSNLLVSFGSDKNAVVDRLNVQLSIHEAKDRLFIIGDEKRMKVNPFFDSLLKKLKKMKRCRNIPDSFSEVNVKPFHCVLELIEEYKSADYLTNISLNK